MALIVQKFGGTSVGSVERIANVAARVARFRERGDDVVVVVSAMSGETNRLLALGRDVAGQGEPAPREMDALVATGEQVASALLAIALGVRGVPARSLLGHQIRLRTDAAHTKARIRTIDDEPLREVLDAGQVAVVAGFQGIDEHGNITTLGRGGSDTTAVALAAALAADLCEIYTDVEGVFTTDPRICPSARKVPKISYEEMLELASLGAKVLQIRSVEMAMKHGVKVHVRSSFTDAEGTLVTKEDESLEAIVVAGVALDRDVAKVTLRGVADEPGLAATLFEALADAHVVVDMIIQNVSADGRTDLTFTVSRGDAETARPIAEKALGEQKRGDVIVDASPAKVSIVGLGMRSHAGVAAKMFRLLAVAGINIEAISTSEIKVSCLISEAHGAEAVRALHEGFGLADPA
ncbi:MAG: aspartate kinase [Sandaracinaceae bacterium]|nr:aspartate kinase [Sandaracinaceae bacterium]